MDIQHNNINPVGNHGEVCKPINENIEESSSMNDSMILYSAHSTVSDFRNRRNVTFLWIKYGTKFKGVDYNNLIEGYDTLDHYDRTLSEKIINELFTEDECALLKNYLKLKHNANLQIDEEFLPHATKFNAWMDSPLSERCNDNNWIDISKEEQYSLPFKVRGHYNLAGCYPTQKLPGKMKTDGVEFLKHALVKLDLKAEPNDAKLKFMIDEIYQDYNLYVNTNPFWTKSFHP